jgi:plastocyanin
MSAAPSASHPGRHPEASHRARLLVAAPVLALVLTLVSGCSNEEPTLPAATRTAGGEVGTVTTDAEGVQEVTLETGDDYVFTPATFTVAPGAVRLTVRNTAEQMTHNFEFSEGKGPAAIAERIPVLGPGQTQTIEFTVTTPGDYGFECTFHVRLGQVGTMTVTG